jgi:hypothetical protein
MDEEDQKEVLKEAITLSLDCTVGVQIMKHMGFKDRGTFSTLDNARPVA